MCLQLQRCHPYPAYHVHVCMIVHMRAGDDKLLGTAARPFSPMEVIGDIYDDGLGLLTWWAPADEEAEPPNE